MSSHELGYFGNIWVRQHVLEKKGNSFPGHTHKFDHVTLLSKGSVMVHVEGKEPKKFTAPTFIIIRKEHQHNIEALEDDTLYYCVFALRNIDGEVVEDIFGEEHDPMSAMSVESNYWEKRKQIENI
jgi:quercetin dioxygenase-like cupin family protein